MAHSIDRDSLEDPSDPSETGETVPTEVDSAPDARPPLEGRGLIAPSPAELGPPVGAERPIVGRVLGRFRVVEKLAFGGLGEVYRAEQELLGRDAVIKVMRRDRAVTPQRAERFLREARLAARLDHPYAAHVYAFGAEPDGLLWIAMELVRGQTLRALVRQRGPMPTPLFAPLAVAVCEVVHAAHELGIVHRDLKPANVMVVASGGRLLPKLLDFGVAKTLEVADLPAESGAPGDAARVRLTRDDQVLGSPHYMAPEQWTAPAAVDRRADVYALGALFYYVLTGQPPFRGDSADEVARARTETVPSPVGGEAGNPLNAVLMRALAGEPDRRFATALDLAAALSNAAAATTTPPGLDALLVETWSARAPEPLAELVFALSSAHTPSEADAVARTLVEALARWLAVMALADESHHDGAPPDRARQLGRVLLDRGLSPAEWLELAQVLVAAAAARAGDPAPEPDGSPAPSEHTPSVGTWPSAPRAVAPAHDGIGTLIEFFAGPGAAALAEVAAHREPLPPGPALHTRLAADLAHLATALGELGAILDSSLVAELGGQPLELSGLRRRRPAALWGPPLAPGELALVGGDGAARLTLSPLVALAPAVAGGDAEVFVLAGGPRGPCLRALPSGAEISGGEAARLVADALDLTTDESERGGPGEDAPYRGLAPFSAGDAARFVGRSREAESFINLVRARRVVGLVGASGAGKSSFLHAGVLAALPEGWTGISLRPGASPVRALISAAGLGLPHSAPADRIAEALVAAAPARGSLVVAVDQMEEVFALGASAEERERFAAALVGAADDGDGKVRVVLCLRDDFLARAEALDPLRGRLASALTVLVTPAPAELRRIVLEPALRAGYRFEDEAVVDEMVAAIADRPGGLALLSFAALAWWELRDREHKLLPTAAYRQLGGVAGALASHAEALYAGMAPRAQRAARDVIRQLVTSEGTRAALPAADLVSLAGPGGDQALEALIAGRLLVARDDIEGDVVELAHEALIEAWPLLRRIREEDAADAGLRDDLRAAARGWSQRHRRDDELWRGRQLAELERFRARADIRLTSLEEEFADAGRALGRRTRRRRRGLVIVTLAAATAAAIALGMAERTARRSEAFARQLADKAQRGEAEAEVRLAEMWAAEGRRESARGSPLRALAYLGQSFGVVDGPGVRYAIARAMTSIDEERAVLRGHHSAVTFAYWSRDGRTIATSDEEEAVKLWSFDDGQIEPAGQLGEHSGVLVGWSADGTRFGLGNEDGISIRSATTMKEVAHIAGARDTKGELGGYFVHDGRSVIVWRKDGFIGVYGLDGRLLRHHQHASGVYYAAVNHRGDKVAFVSMTGGLNFWDARGRVRPILPADVPIGDVELDDSGDVVVVGGADGQAQVFDFDSGKRRHLLATHAGRHPITVSRDGRWIATGGADRTAKLWEAASGRLVATMSEHRGPIGMLAFDPTSQQLATACGDGAVRIYNLRGVMLAAYEGHTADVLEVDWSPDGTWIASAAADGLAAIWPGRTPQTRELAGGDGELMDVLLCGQTIAIEHEKELVLRDLASDRITRKIPLPEEIYALACSAEAGRLAIGDEKKVRLLDLAGEPVGEFAKQKTPVGAMTFSRDGRSIATLNYEGGLRLWSAADGSAGPVLMRERPKDPTHASALEFTADGKALFIGDSTGHVAVWSTDGGGELARRRVHQNEIMYLVVSPDGSRLAAASSDRSLSITRTGDLELERTIEEHAAFITSIDWSDDGGLLVTGSADSSAYVWEVASGALVGEIRPGRGAVASALFAGDHIIAASRGGRVMSFPAHLERRSPDEIRQILSCRLPYRLTGSSRMERVTPGEGCAQSTAAPAAHAPHR